MWGEGTGKGDKWLQTGNMANRGSLHSQVTQKGVMMQQFSC